LLLEKGDKRKHRNFYVLSADRHASVAAAAAAAAADLGHRETDRQVPAAVTASK